MSHKDSKHPLVITIGRQMGCGGRYLGRMLAERLGIGYYDRELLVNAAQAAGIAPEFMQTRDEKSPAFLSGLLSFTFGHNPVHFYGTSSVISDDKVYALQSDCIRRLGDSESCVIVGRTADYVLRHHPRCVNVFLHADIEDCAHRLLERGAAATLSEARALVNRTNKIRASYYNFFTDRRWGYASTYDLTFNTSRMSIEQIADVIIYYIKTRYGDDI